MYTTYARVVQWWSVADTPVGGADLHWTIASGCYLRRWWMSWLIRVTAR
jgi:hypothetical protein